MKIQKLTNKENVHIYLSIGCPKAEHGAFYVDTETGNFICDDCGEYFTDEVKRIYQALKETFEKKSKIRV